MSGAGTIDYSIVVPVFNEEGNLPTLLAEIVETIEPLGSTYEVVFVDDGSKDNSLEVMKTLLGENDAVKIVVFEKNAGQSAALKAGFEHAEGKVFITMDADLQNDPHDMPLLIHELERFDVAVGWRHKRKDTFVKRMTSKIGNACRNALTHESVADTGCSLKAFKREAALSIPFFNGMHRFMPTVCRMNGYSVTQVKVNHRPRIHGETKYGVFDRLRATLPDLFAVRWMQKRVTRYRVKEVLKK